METKFCEKCKQWLPIQNFECHKNCRKCYKQDYYQRNKTKILERSKKNRDNEKLEKMNSGNYKWKGNIQKEEEMMKIFLKQNNIDLSNLFT